MVLLVTSFIAIHTVQVDDSVFYVSKKQCKSYQYVCKSWYECNVVVIFLILLLLFYLISSFFLLLSLLTFKSLKNWGKKKSVLYLEHFLRDSHCLCVEFAFAGVGLHNVTC